MDSKKYPMILKSLRVCCVVAIAACLLSVLIGFVLLIPISQQNISDLGSVVEVMLNLIVVLYIKSITVTAGIIAALAGGLYMLFNHLHKRDIEKKSEDLSADCKE